MNRLTHKRENGIKTGYWSPEKKEDLVQRLAAYENTGLEPEEIVKDKQNNDAQEVKHGKWEVCGILDYAQRPSGRKLLRCPFCKYLTDDFRSIVEYHHALTNFCPNCGAKMDGKETEDERNN